MKTKALFTLLSQKMRDGQLLFVDSLAMTEPKTKEAKNIITNLSTVDGFAELATKRKNTVCIASAEYAPNTYKSFANFGNVKFDEIRNLNPVDVLHYKYLIIEKPETSVETLNARLK